MNLPWPSVATDDAADAVSAAKAATLTFDDVQLEPSGFADMPSGYGGLTWSSEFLVADPKTLLNGDGYDGSGFFKGRTSGKQIAFNDSGDNVSVAATGHFDLRTVELTAGTDRKLVVNIYAYQGDRQVAHDTVTLTDAHATLVKLDYRNVTEVDFVPGKATPDPRFSDSGTYIVFDDMKVANVLNSDTTAPRPFGTTHQMPVADLTAHSIVSGSGDGGHLVHPIA